MGYEPREVKVDELGRAYAVALLAGDEVDAELVIRDAMDAGLSSAEIDDSIITPALWLVGDLWQKGEITVADEHLATEISLRVLALQREVRRVAHERSDHLVMCAAPTAELHVVALRMTANLLREAGYDVLMLGADVPPYALAEAAARYRADVICLSSTMAGSADQVLVSIHEVQKRRPAAGFVLGGRGVTSRLRRWPGIGVCERVSEVVETVDALVKRAALN